MCVQFRHVMSSKLQVSDSASEMLKQLLLLRPGIVLSALLTFSVDLPIFVRLRLAHCSKKDPVCNSN